MELPAQGQLVQQLQAVVNEGPLTGQTNPTSGAGASSSVSTSLNSVVAIPGGSQAENVTESPASVLQTPVPSEGAPYYVQQNNEWCDQYGQCIPSSAFAYSPAQGSSGGVGAANTAAEFGATPSQTSNQTVADPITQIIQTVVGWWQGILSAFTPAQTPTGQVQQCSLFKSLFGGCNG